MKKIVSTEQTNANKESIYWVARTIAMHELEHLADLENKLNKVGNTQ